MGVMDETTLLVFVLSIQSEINTHLLDNPAHALQEVQHFCCSHIINHFGSHPFKINEKQVTEIRRTIKPQCL